MAGFKSFVSQHVVTIPIPVLFGRDTTILICLLSVLMDNVVYCDRIEFTSSFIATIYLMKIDDSSHAIFREFTGLFKDIILQDDFCATIITLCITHGNMNQTVL